jgi:ankyrin repeat protein
LLWNDSISFLLAVWISEAHRWAITTVKEPSAPVPFPKGLSANFAQERDHFGNTPLHFVAANATGSTMTSWRTMKWLIHKGANVRARNTLGETFMHILHPERLRDAEQYAELLQMLAELEFPFSQRDYHGQTLAEIFFTAIDPRQIPLVDLRVIISHLFSRIDLLGGSEEFWEQLLKNTDDTKEGRSKRAIELAAVLAQYRKPLPSFRSANFWFRRPEMTNIVKEVDVNGDSALIYIVKAWREEHDECQLAHIIEGLVTSGAEISMRDRWGDTALAVAARRGLRPAAKALLACGANPNTRNYRGRGILSQTTEYLRRAKFEEEGSRYARILSCVTLLTDYGAMEEPSAYDEFLSPTALAKLHLAPGIV